MIADPMGIAGYHGVDMAKARRMADAVTVVDGVAQWLNPLAVDRHGRLHDGHHRAMATRILGALCAIELVTVADAPPDSPEWAAKRGPRLAVEDTAEHERITAWAAARTPSTDHEKERNP